MARPSTVLPRFEHLTSGTPPCRPDNTHRHASGPSHTAIFHDILIPVVAQHRRLSRRTYPVTTSPHPVYMALPVQLTRSGPRYTRPAQISHCSWVRHCFRRRCRWEWRCSGNGRCRRRQSGGADGCCQLWANQSQELYVAFISLCLLGGLSCRKVSLWDVG